MFSNSQVFFLKLYIFEVVAYFLDSCLFNQLTFSVVAHSYKIHLFGEALIFPLSSHCYDNWKSVFFLFTWEPLKQIHSSQSSSLSPQTTLILKNSSQTDRLLKKLLRTQVITMRSKSSKNYFLDFTKTDHIPAWLWLV